MVSMVRKLQQTQILNKYRKLEELTFFKNVAFDKYTDICLKGLFIIRYNDWPESKIIIKEIILRLDVVFIALNALIAVECP